MRAEIPIGISFDGKKIALPFSVPGRNHCAVFGCRGSGKTTCLRRIVSSAEGICDPSRVTVWADPAAGGEHPGGYSEARRAGPAGAERTDRLIGLLYKEHGQRLRLMAREGVPDHSGCGLPLLIAVIDDIDFEPRHGLPGEKGRTGGMLSEILRASHVTGISVTVSFGRPLFLPGEGLYAVMDLFNMRIAMNSPFDQACGALGLDPSAVSGADRAAIEGLRFGEPGDFVYANVHDMGPLVAGRIGCWPAQREGIRS